MLSEARWIKPLRFRWRLACKRSLPLRYHAQFGEPLQRAGIFPDCQIRVTPRVQSGRSLRQTRQEDRLGERQISRRLAVVSARGCFGSEPAVAIAAAVKILCQDTILAPFPFELPREDRFVELAEP